MSFFEVTEVSKSEYRCAYRSAVFVRKRVRSVLGSQPARPRREFLSTTQLVMAVVVLATISLLAWRRGDWFHRPASSQVAASGGSQTSRSAASPLTADTQRVGDPTANKNSQAASERPIASAVLRADPPAKAAASPVAYWAVDAAPPLVLPADRPIELDRIVPAPVRPCAPPRAAVPAWSSAAGPRCWPWKMFRSRISISCSILRRRRHLAAR